MSDGQAPQLVTQLLGELLKGLCLCIARRVPLDDHCFQGLDTELQGCQGLTAQVVDFMGDSLALHLGGGNELLWEVEDLVGLLLKRAIDVQVKRCQE